MEEAYCKELEGFIRAFKTFFDHASALDYHEVPVLDCADIRVELFKLFYISGEFVLYKKADAAEAFDKILNLLHGWVASGRIETEKDRLTAENLECKDQLCLVHECFFSDHYQ